MINILQVGKTYTTRNGMTVKTNAKLDFPNMFPFRGDIYKKDGSKFRLGYFTPDGRYTSDSVSDFDIVKEAE